MEDKAKNSAPCCFRPYSDIVRSTIFRRPSLSSVFLRRSPDARLYSASGLTTARTPSAHAPFDASQSHIAGSFPVGGHLSAAATSGSTSNPCILLLQEIEANFDIIPKCNGDNDSRLPSWFLKALATCLIITALLKRYLLMGGSIIPLAVAGLTALAMLVLYAFQEYRRKREETEDVADNSRNERLRRGRRIAYAMWAVI
ncbi:uncharacterized protein LOC144103776 [Amblyomma americanum]